MIDFYVNGVHQGVAFTDLVGPVLPAVSLTATNSEVSWWSRFWSYEEFNARKLWERSLGRGCVWWGVVGEWGGVWVGVQPKLPNPKTCAVQEEKSHLQHLIKKSPLFEKNLWKCQFQIISCARSDTYESIIEFKISALLNSKSRPARKHSSRVVVGVGVSSCVYHLCVCVDVGLWLCWCVFVSVFACVSLCPAVRGCNLIFVITFVRRVNEKFSARRSCRQFHRTLLWFVSGSTSSQRWR